MSKFVCFVDYADNPIIDGELDQFNRLPEQGEAVSWLDRDGNRKIAVVSEIKASIDEITVQLGRVQDISDIPEMFNYDSRSEKLFSSQQSEELIIRK